jgi:hypothetical protein
VIGAVAALGDAEIEASTDMPAHLAAIRA